MSKASLGFLLAIVTALSLVQPVSAQTRTSVIADPEGDAFFMFNFNSPLVAPGYQDIVKASAGLNDARFDFRMKMASEIPGSPALPSGLTLFEWRWSINTDPNSVPCGYPVSPGLCGQGDFEVQIFWDGTSFAAQLADRRPLVSGGDVLLLPLDSLQVKGSEFRVFVDAASLGTPSRFVEWGAGTIDWAAEPGTGSFLPVDVTDFGTWPP